MSRWAPRSTTSPSSRISRPARPTPRPPSRCGTDPQQKPPMPKFAANLTMLYNEIDFLDRFAAATEGGFKGVEYLFPYAYPKEQLAERLHQHGVKQVLHNLPAGDWAAGERGIACQPDRVGEFQDGVGKAIDYARALGCGQVNCLAGIAPTIPGATNRERVRSTIVSCSALSIRSATRAGSAASTSPKERRSTDWAGALLTASECKKASNRSEEETWRTSDSSDSASWDRRWRVT